MGLLVVVSTPVAERGNPSQQLAQSADLDEVEQLNQQVEQLYNEGKYSTASVASSISALSRRLYQDLPK